MSLSPAVWQRVRDGVGPDVDAVSAVAREEVGALGARRVDDSTRSMASRVLGAGVLDPFLAEPHVTDVAVNGDGRVWIDRGNGMEWTGDRLSRGDARLLAVRLAGSAGRRLDEASPWVDGQLPSGARLHAILPPLVAGGAHITIRVPPREQTSLVELGGAGHVPPDVAGGPAGDRASSARLPRLGAARARARRRCSPRSSGAPTRHDRLLLVEDVRELAVDHPHVVRLEARPANVEGAGEVTLTTLVRQSLRMRPDRIVVGEVRGAEVRELLAALNTGHEGGCGTIHANAPADVLARLEALGALAGLGPEAVRAQAAAAIDLVLHVVRDGPTPRASAPSPRCCVGAAVRRGSVLDWPGGEAAPVPGRPGRRSRARLRLPDLPELAGVADLADGGAGDG